jgi:hypothetical protein
MTYRQIEELILVYSARSGLASAIVDSAKKLLRLKGCTLCTITHGTVGERPEWQECKEALGVPIRYYHRDDLPQDLQRFGADALPCILARVGGEYRLLLDPEALERCNGHVADLRGRVRHRAALEGLQFEGTRRAVS